MKGIAVILNSSDILDLVGFEADFGSIKAIEFIINFT
jgi:hypothetical protein